MTPRTVTIHYRRLHGGVEIFEQAVLEEGPGYIVTLLERAQIDRPVLVDGSPILEPGSPVVWFTYPDAWHDIGRFHLADGTFTGFYANILTPVRMDGDQWETTDLCLDVWLDAAGSVRLLDEDELDDALRDGWVDIATAEAAITNARALLRDAGNGRWPAPHVHDWTLDGARARLAQLHGGIPH